MTTVVRRSLILMGLIGILAMILFIWVRPDSTTAVAQLDNRFEEHTCPVTEPSDSPFVPPDGWPTRPPDPMRFWVGSADLWTALPVDGRWTQLAHGEKFWWWSAGYSTADEPQPDLVVTARRLDESGPPPVRFDQATHGFHASFGEAMLIGVELPATGCWEITGRYRDNFLSVVVEVPE